MQFIEGKVTIGLDEERSAADSVVLWLYPNRLSIAPEGLNAENRHWVYPYDFNPGWMKVLKVTSGGKDITGSVSSVSLPSDHPLSGVNNVAVEVKLPGECEGGGSEPGRRKIEIRYKVRIPKRYGLFGRTGKGLFMAAGWYPILVRAGENGKADFYSPPERADVDVEIELDSELHLIVEDEYYPPSGEGGRRSVSTGLSKAAHVSLGIYKELHRFTVECEGYTLRMFTHAAFKIPPDYQPGGEEVGGIPAGLPDVSKPDRIGHSLDVLCRGAELLGLSGVKVPGGKTVTVVETSMRMQLAYSTENVVFMSDRIYDVFAMKKFWKFHDLQLLRAFFNHMFLRIFKHLGHSTASSALEADFASTDMVDKYVRDVIEKEEFAEDILKWVAFISSIDYILYSPMVQFREAYFHSIAEKDWLRDEPWAFMNMLPKGKLIYEKLKDIVGEETLKSVVSGLIKGEGDIYELAGDAAGMDMGWFFKQWSVCYPSLNYRVKKLGTEKLPDGKRKHAVKIFREGDSWVREPVVVRFKFLGGGHEDVVWFEAGGEGTLEVISEKRLANVVIDPEGRLFEDASLMKNHPKFDNALWQSMRPPVFAGFNLWSSLSDESISLLALFNMRRKYDLMINYRFLVEVSSFGYGLSAWALHGLGRKLDLNYSKFYLGPLISVFHHNPAFGYKRVEDAAGELMGGGREIGATALSVGMYSCYNTIYFPFDPDRGLALKTYLAYHLNIADDRKIHHSFSASMRAFYIYPFSGAHHLVAYGAVGGTFFDMPEGQLQGLSDRLALRGFERDETLGRIKAYAALEYRHLWVYGLGWSFLDIVTLEGLKGVLFAGGGTVSNRENYDGMLRKDRMFAEVGYGLVLLVTYMGCLLYTSPSPRDVEESRMPSSA